MGEIVGAMLLTDVNRSLRPSFSTNSIKVTYDGKDDKDGQTYIDKAGKSMKILDIVDPQALYSLFSHQLGNKNQSAVVGSFEDQKKIWSTPPNQTGSII